MQKKKQRKHLTHHERLLAEYCVKCYGRRITATVFGVSIRQIDDLIQKREIKPCPAGEGLKRLVELAQPAKIRMECRKNLHTKETFKEIKSGIEKNNLSYKNKVALLKNYDKTEKEVINTRRY
ncbi:hypothetical protein ACTBAC_004696 [Vibrio parahaemolyticus]|nr:hypothetical protein [Vibrio parahaemolyticus]